MTGLDWTGLTSVVGVASLVSGVNGISAPLHFQERASRVPFSSFIVPVPIKVTQDIGNTGKSQSMERVLDNYLSIVNVVKPYGTLGGWTNTC